MQRPQPLIDFIVMMGLSKSEKYQEAAITFSLSSSCHRFFAELLLYRLNESTPCLIE